MPFVLSRKPTIKCEATQDVPQAMPQFESPKNILTFPCLDCGKIVNKKIRIKQCTEESHARRRMDMDKFCVHCGEQMIK